MDNGQSFKNRSYLTKSWKCNENWKLPVSIAMWWVFVIVSFFDLSRAFDIINPDFILNRISLEIRETALNLIKSSKTSQVALNNKHSSVYQLTLVFLKGPFWSHLHSSCTLMMTCPIWLREVSHYVWWWYINHCFTLALIHPSQRIIVGEATIPPFYTMDKKLLHSFSGFVYIYRPHAILSTFTGFFLHCFKG